MEEKPDDDEIPNYITELNTVIAKQEITSKPEVITKIALTSQNKILLISANHKKENSYLSDQLDKLKFSLTILMEAV